MVRCTSASMRVCDAVFAMQSMTLNCSHVDHRFKDITHDWNLRHNITSYHTVPQLIEMHFHQMESRISVPASFPYPVLITQRSVSQWIYPGAGDNRAISDNKGDFNKLYRNLDIIFEITFVIWHCAVIDVARFLTALVSLKSQLNVRITVSWFKQAVRTTEMSLLPSNIWHLVVTSTISCK